MPSNIFTFCCYSEGTIVHVTVSNIYIIGCIAGLAPKSIWIFTLFAFTHEWYTCRWRIPYKYFQIIWQNAFSSWRDTVWAIVLCMKWTNRFWFKTKNKKKHGTEMSGMNIDANGVASGTGKSLPQSPASMVSSESETQSISDEQTTSSTRRVNFYHFWLVHFSCLCVFFCTHGFIDLLK